MLSALLFIPEQLPLFDVYGQSGIADLDESYHRPTPLTVDCFPVSSLSQRFPFRPSPKRRGSLHRHRSPFEARPGGRGSHRVRGRSIGDARRLIDVSSRGHRVGTLGIAAHAILSNSKAMRHAGLGLIAALAAATIAACDSSDDGSDDVKTE